MKNAIAKTISVKVMIVTFNEPRMKPFDTPKFRGYLSAKYKDYHIIHNHIEGDRFRYAYPSIQFKVLQQKPTIIGIGEGIDVLKKVFMDIMQININGNVYNIDEKSIQLKSLPFGMTNQPVQYKFLLPWMALNQNNHRKYVELPWNEKRKFLEKILRGNLLSLSKGFKYTIPDFDNIHVQTGLKAVTRKFKNNKMICLVGKFLTNFLIPDYLGIGKQAARGFGTVIKVKDHKEKMGRIAEGN